ncbi:MAG: ABC transporter permease [Phycisphaerae bacterium]|jgi:simple sugar transport system permease protein|nr:ABC transporter permease [Phycisphaerae bacterium]
MLAALQFDISLTFSEIGFLAVITALVAAAWCLKTPAVWPLIALAILAVFNAFFTVDFFELKWLDSHLFGVPIDILKNGSYVMLLALGMTLVIATGGVDLSVGAVMAISGAAAAVLIREHEAPLMVVLTVPIAIALLAGLWNGLLVAIFKIQPLVATLVLMVAGRGVAMLITEGFRPTITRQYHAYEEFVYVGNGFFLALPFAVTIVAVMFALTALLTRKTALGMFIESVGDNDTASRYSGVNARAVKLMVYTFAGLCAGIAGLIYTSNIRTGDPSKTGLYLELDAIMAVVIGGTALTGGRFSLLGSTVGALLIQALTTTMLIHGLSSDQALVPKALVVVAVCLLQAPEFHRKIQGLLGRTGRRRAAG